MINDRSQSLYSREYYALETLNQECISTLYVLISRLFIALKNAHENHAL